MPSRTATPAASSRPSSSPPSMRASRRHSPGGGVSGSSRATVQVSPASTKKGVWNCASCSKRSPPSPLQASFTVWNSSSVETKGSPESLVT